MMMNSKKNRFYERFDLVFWSIIKMIPIILLIISSINNVIDFAYIESFMVNFNVPFISDILIEIFDIATISVPNVVVYMLSYFFIVEFSHLLLDCLLFIVRLGHKLLGGAFQ